MVSYDPVIWGEKKGGGGGVHGLKNWCFVHHPQKYPW